jgi:type I restriction enzyme S subunit
MKAWPKVRLGEILRHRKEFITIDDLPTYKRPRVQLHAQGIVLRDEIPGAIIKTKSQQVCKAGEFLVAEIDAKVGGFGIVPDHLGGCIVSSHYFLFVLDETKILRSFLDYFIRTPAFQDQVEAQGSTNYAAIRPQHVLNYEIPLPLLQEQQRIVARIEELSSLINEARTLRQQAVKEAEALISSTRRKEIGNQPLSDWIPLSRIVSEIENGKSPQCESRPALENEWGVLKVGAVSFGNFNPNENKALPSAQPYSAHYEVHPGDFLMSRANTTELVGACAIVDQTRPKLLLSDKIFRFHFHDQNAVILQWLDHVMKSPALRDQIERAASGTSPTMKNISKEKTLNLLIPPHSISKQRQIISHLNRLQAEMSSMKNLQSHSAEEIDALLPAILHRAFRGELV